MIILFEENETKFANLGLGIMSNVLSCKVKEKLNDEFTLLMEYPIIGINFNKLTENRILYCKPNPYDTAQAFRIHSISKAINGVVTVEAMHISYDQNSIPVKAFSATSIQDAIVQIQNGSVVDNPFTFISDITQAKTYKTTAPYNLRAILMSEEKSIVAEYNAELKFDNFRIYILEKRGKDRGAVVRYGKNMTDITHAQSNELLYNGVFPFYHTEQESTETTSNGEFTQVHIVGSSPFQSNWFSYSKDGSPYEPLDTSPVQVATEGDYYQKVYTWDDIYKIYKEKIYNEQIMIIEGVLEPSWVSIDFSGFPVVACKAARKGYFKLSTDENWGEIKGVGDTVFEGSILSSSTMENMIMYFSEVIPSRSDTEKTEVTEIVDVQLDEGVIWVETTTAKAMKHNRVLMLDLTSEFEEAPTKERLKTKAEEYIAKNKIGTIKRSTTLSFIDLSSTTENSQSEHLDHVEVGDTVKIIYTEAGVETSLRVLSVEYNVISNRYESVELGEKKDKMSESTIQNGDNVSSLTNDVGYATVTTVNKLIADTVTANYIESLNAKLTKAQISQLEVERINVKGILEASQFTLDSLVAKLLVADTAEIANTLAAGNIKVAGDVSITSGMITIKSNDGTTSFSVDRQGNVKTNSVEITGGTLNINNGMFEVTNDGYLSATMATIEGTITAESGRIANFNIDTDKLYTDTISFGIDGLKIKDAFYVDSTGVLKASGAEISGKITASEGSIGGFDINGSALYIDPNTSPMPGNADSVWISPGKSSNKDIGGSDVGKTWAFAVGNKFGVTTSGELYTASIHINGGSISITNNEKEFSVDPTGVLTAIGAEISGNITALTGSIGGFTISNDVLYNDTSGEPKPGTMNSIWLSGVGKDSNLSIANSNPEGQTITRSWLLTASKNFGVDKNGIVYATDAKISGEISNTSEMHYERYSVIPRKHITLKKNDQTTNDPIVYYDNTKWKIKTIISEKGITTSLYSGTDSRYGYSYESGNGSPEIYKGDFNILTTMNASTNVHTITNSPQPIILGSSSVGGDGVYTGLGIYSNDYLSLTMKEKNIIGSRSYYFDSSMKKILDEKIEIGDGDWERVEVSSGKDIHFYPYRKAYFGHSTILSEQHAVSVTSLPSLQHYYINGVKENWLNADGSSSRQQLFMLCGTTTSIPANSWVAIETLTNVRVLSVVANTYRANDSSLTNVQGGCQVYWSRTLDTNNSVTTVYIGSDVTYETRVSWMIIGYRSLDKYAPG